MVQQKKLYGLERFSEPISTVRHPQVIRDYVNRALDNLQSHTEHPQEGRERPIAYGVCISHMAPNHASAGILGWMIRETGLVETSISAGVIRVNPSRITTYAAEVLLDQYHGHTLKGYRAMVLEAIGIEREIAARQVAQVLEQNRILQEQLDKLTGDAPN